MDLYYLKGSLWSARVIWFYSLLPAPVKKEVNLKPVLAAQEMMLYTRNAENYLFPEDDKKMVTLPMMIFKDGDKKKFVGDGIEIVKFLAQRAEGTEKDDFSAKQIKDFEAVENWNSKTDLGMRYARYLFVNATDDFVKYIAPTWVNYIPFATKAATSLVQRQLKAKYYPDDSKIVPLEKVEEVMKEANEILEKQNYLLGDEFSYADISFTVMLEGLLPMDLGRPITAYGSLTPEAVKEFKKNGWEEKYPHAFRLRDDMMKNHLPEEALTSGGVEIKTKIEAK